MILSLPRMLPVLAVALAGLFAGHSSVAHAARFDVLSAQQTAPGRVAVTVALDAQGSPQPGELALEFDGSGAVVASEIAPVARREGASASNWLVLCLDRSGSIGPDALRALKSELGEGLRAQGSPELGFKVAVVDFGARSHYGAFSGRTAEVAAAIDKIQLDNRGETRLNDAIASALAGLRAVGEGQGARRLIVASDGKDVGSLLSTRELVQLAQQAPRIAIDAMSFGALAARESDSLAVIAGATGGRFVQVTDPGELGQAVRTLLSGIAPAPVFTATFSYPVSTDESRTASATLLYTAEAQPPVRRPLGIAVAAQTQAQAPVPAEGPAAVNRLASDDERPGAFQRVIAWARTFPEGYAWIAAAILALLLLLLVFALRTRRTSEPEPERPGAEGGAGGPSPSAGAAQRRVTTVVGHVWDEPREGFPTAVLRGASGALRGRQFAIEKVVYRVGCAPDNDLVLVGDDFASGRHALVRFDNGALYVEDLGATNGTLLNGSLFKSATRSLSPGDELRFGRTTLMLQPAGDRRAPPAGPGRSGIEQSLA